MAQKFLYDWDPEKARSNLTKHKVSFEDAMTVFEDRLTLTRPDPDSIEEERWITIGASKSRGLILVIHTHAEMDDDVIYIRIISARRPTRNERRQYEQETH